VGIDNIEGGNRGEGLLRYARNDGVKAPHAERFDSSPESMV